MTTSESTILATVHERDGAATSGFADLSRNDIQAIAAQAAHARAVETGRLLRAAWFAFVRLWHKPRKLMAEGASGEVVGTSR